MLRKIAIFITLCFALLGVAAVAQDGYQLWVNGAVSKFHPQRVGDKTVVPLYFPAEKEEAEWTVKVRRDEKTKKIDVKMTPRRAKTRGDNPCHICLQTGKCQTCYPAGSGNNTSGAPDYMCTATGKCWYCGGAGTW